MSNNSVSPLSRRGLLKMAMIAAGCAVAGCGGEPAVTQVEKPAVEKGGRKRLDMFTEKAEQGASKKK